MPWQNLNLANPLGMSAKVGHYGSVRLAIEPCEAGEASEVVYPRGAQVGLGLASKAPSVFAWNDLLTEDAEAAANFYAALADFTIDTIDFGSAGLYHQLLSGGNRVAGVMKHPANLHPHWQSYLGVKDVDAITARALQLGAKLFRAL